MDPTKADSPSARKTPAFASKYVPIVQFICGCQIHGRDQVTKLSYCLKFSSLRPSYTPPLKPIDRQTISLPDRVCGAKPINGNTKIIQWSLRCINSLNA